MYERIYQNEISGSHGDEYKITVFWNVAPCNWPTFQRSVQPPLSLIALMMEAVSCSEVSVSIYQTTQNNIVEDKTSSSYQSLPYTLHPWNCPFHKLTILLLPISRNGQFFVHFLPSSWMSWAKIWRGQQPNLKRNIQICPVHEVSFFTHAV
jgi:hypothetical protein